MTRRTDDTLTQTMTALAQLEAGAETPSRVEAAVMARWDAAHAPRAHSSRARFVRAAGATAAGMTLVAAFAWQQEAGHVEIAWPPSPARLIAPLPAPELPRLAASAHQTPIVERSPDDVTASPANSGGQTTVYFIGGPIAMDEPVRVVRMRVAWSALRDFGLLDDGQTETVDIDVLVGEDGVARGVRMMM